MSPPTNAVRTISQEAFDELVKENMDDLGMDPAESLQDAIETLTLQGVDLSGIVTCVPGEGGVDDNPVIQCLNKLKAFPKDQNLDSVARLFENLAELCSVQGSGNAAIATKNGAVELICSLCSEIQIEQEKALVSTLKAMSSVLHDLQSTETFRASGGPSIVVNILNGGVQNLDILNSGFAVLKDEFMELKIDELILHALNRPGEGSIQSLYDAIRVLLTPDDNRVLASQVYGYARKFAKIGIAEALVASLQTELSSPSLVSASIALKAVAVNDEICRSIAENGGIDALLRCIDDSGEQGNKSVARVCCSLLSKLAGSDTNKNVIIEKGGLDRLIKLAARFSDDPSVLHEVMSIISILSLRSPERAARAMEAGSGDLAIQAMQKFPAAQQMQKSACLMIRNLVARNPENRTILLNNGVEKHIRKTKQNHEFCREAATDALRDLGLDDYNS
uniref:Armadillo repeat-containing protein 6 n=1 Tax=Cannabis sativa TaxID=3483 RepID=A0A803NPF3_CANSA